MRVALATAAVVPPEFDDDDLLAAALRRRGASARFVRWDDPAAAWSRYDRVVIRSTWDYTLRREDFLAWAESVAERLHNDPALVRWNSDKRYLGDLGSAGLPVVPTTYLAPGDVPPELSGEVVVKPVVSAGGRDTGRFGPGAHRAARALLERLSRAGRTAMIQPYLERVDSLGETALVLVRGRLTHALRKQAVLRPDEEAPTRADALAAAEAMYDPGLVRAGAAGAAHRHLAADAVGHLAARFGGPPLYARVDTVPDASGEPLLLELEAIEPCLYLRTAPAAADRLAAAIVNLGPPS